MNKILATDKFEEKLKKWRINYIRHNPYHIQIQSVHNFYPSTRKYFNTETMEREIYPDFKDGQQLLEYMGIKNQKINTSGLKLVWTEHPTFGKIPYGIRNDGGFILTFTKIPHFQGQEDRYKCELKEQKQIAHHLFNSLKNLDNEF